MAMKKNNADKKDSGHSFEDYFKRAANPLLVLLLLTERSMYVYEMAQSIAQRSGGKYVASLLYPVIYRLVDQGYIKESGKQISDDNRVRQYYEITPEGIDYLQEIQQVYDTMTNAVRIIREQNRVLGH